LVRQALLAVRHRLAVEHDTIAGQGAHRRRDGHELVGPVPPVPRPQPNAVAVLAGDDAKAVVLELVNPAVADGDLDAQKGG
jgi:hypothetical protein